MMPTTMPTTEPKDTSPTPRAPERAVTITVLYDNNPQDPRLETAWGFACLVEGLEQVILFDTGGNGALLLRNMARLRIAPARVDVVVLSHVHADHTGGLGGFLEQNHDVTVYAPASFPQSIKDAILKAGAALVTVSGPQDVCSRARLTGELGTSIKEMSLLLEGPDGLVVVTGCAHPGIVEIVRSAKTQTGLPVDLVLGGFHLGDASAARIEAIVEELGAMGVRRVAPSHCSGDLARRLFEEADQPGFVRIGAGARLEVGSIGGREGGWHF